MSSSTESSLVVPDEFIAEVANAGDSVARWVSSLPELIGELAGSWNVDLDLGSPRFGANALVVLGARRGEPCALKVSRPDYSLTSEAEALRIWGGRGAVNRLEWSRSENALLLEGLDPERSLESLPLEEAAGVVGRLTRRLAVPAPGGFGGSFGTERATGVYYSKQSELGEPLPNQWVQLAERLREDLLRTMSQMLVPSDLHSGNVLAGSREPWLAIDPRPVVGDPEISLADVLLWRLPPEAEPQDVTVLLEAMVAAGDLDPRRARAWMIVRAVAHWLWCCSADAALPPEAPRCSMCAPRCTRILEALA